MHKIPIIKETTDISENINKFILRYRKRILDIMIEEIDLKIKNNENYEPFMQEKIKYKEIHSLISNELGTVVHR